MIIRIWRAKATEAGAKKYQEHFEQRVMPELKTLSGFIEAYLLNSEHDGMVDIEVHTLWESLDAIRAFAAPDIQTAVVEPEAQEVLTEFDKTVSHFMALKFTNPKHLGGITPLN